MFSYTIHNPKKIKINTVNYCAVPFGYRCTSALACIYANIRKFSLPFDWVMPLFPNKIKKILENDFNDYIPDVHNGVFCNIYDIELVHFNDNIDEGIDEYKRRIDRFRNIIKQPTHLYFIYSNEDYLTKSQYRTEEFNNNIFNEMLDLENYLKKYTSNYTIIYFSFTRHNIPSNSNIINIIIHTNQYDVNFKIIEQFRIYCGKILSILFKTQLNIDNFTFND